MNPDFLYALGGGALIGLSSALLLLANGRIAGISGIVGGALAPRRGDFGWRLAFVVGLIGGAAMQLVMPERMSTAGMPSLGWVALAGLLVGFGTRLGSGCTSGHGVCGMSRGSPRSISATMTFMATAALTVFVARHLS
jgi:uncharacterized membrane protein YedE/YeeE